MVGVQQARAAMRLRYARGAMRSTARTGADPIERRKAGSEQECAATRSREKSGMRSGFAKTVGTGPVRPIPSGSGPDRYTNQSGSHPKPCLKFLNLNELAGLTGLPAGFFNRGNSHGFLTLDETRVPKWPSGFCTTWLYIYLGQPNGYLHQILYFGYWIIGLTQTNLHP
jgi:hypothetical protein